MAGGGPPALQAAAAAAPILLILVAMLGAGWSAARAGSAALALAALLAVTLFDFAAAGFAGVAAEALFLAATILWILWPALALHAHQQRAGAIDALRDGLDRLSGARAPRLLLVGWFAALFFEGAAGFGTPVALAAPLLVGLGVPPLQAVGVALLGHAAGVSFGALGTPVAAQVALTELPAGEIAWRTALLHAALGGVLMVFVVRAMAPAGPGARAEPIAGWAAFAAAAFLLPSLAIAAWLGPELATLGAALLGGIGFAALVRWRSGGGAAAATADGGALLRALWPYAVLVALVIATRALPPVTEALRSVTLGWRWREQFHGSLQPLLHPGTLLFAALLIGARLQRVPLREVAGSLADAARRLVPVCAALLAMLGLARLMLHAGLVDALQQAAVQGLAGAWPLAAPAVGALGSFVTGSATASNVLFTTLQAQTAQALGLPVALLVAAQGFGAAIGNVVCPHNIIAGAATVGATGREAEILRRTLVPCLVYLALGGALVALLARAA